MCVGFKGARMRALSVALTGVFLHLAALPGAAEEVTVAVKNAVVRKSPSFIAPAAFQTVYGDRFEQIGGESGWVQVKSGKGSGWLHQSAVTEKKIDLTALSTSGSSAKGSSAEVVFAAKGIDGGANGSDGIALPGNGFDDAAEKVLASRGHGSGYSSLDKLATLGGKGDDLASFAKQGGLLK